uniref:M23ase beta-sheet core domain-containing protein n=2 Tax=Pandoraea faecigallinarum TaxID=656179 RepID=A0A173GZV3_9BURK
MAAAGEPLHSHQRLTAPSAFLHTLPSVTTAPVALSQSICGTITPLSPTPVSTATAMGRSGLFAPLTTGPAARAAKTFLVPVAGARMTSDFGHRRHPVRRISHRHNGVDFAAPTGTPVLAAADGTVKHIGNERRGFGRYIVISHRYESETVYAHLSSLARDLRVGNAVISGQVIGAVGQTGMATGPHLHFELRRRGLPVDPAPLLHQRGAKTRADGETFAANGCQSVLNAVPLWHVSSPMPSPMGGQGAAPSSVRTTPARWTYSPL